MVDGGVELDNSTVSLTSGPVGFSSDSDSVEVHSRPARDGSSGEVDQWRVLGYWVSGRVAVVSVVATASLDSDIRSDGVTGVVQVESLTDIVVDAMVRLDQVAIVSSLQRSALSSTLHISSNTVVVVSSVDSDVASERNSRESVLGRIDTDITVATTSSKSWFDVLTDVVDIELLTDSRWITSVDSSLMIGSSDSGVDAHRSTLTLATDVFRRSQEVSVELDSSVAGDWRFSVVLEWWDGDSNDVLDVTVIGLVTTTSHDFTVSWKSIAGVVKFQLSADGGVDTVEGLDAASIGKFS